eukprot:CAMPEP_0206241392 /NCGR_PEP_ID=MMETSP0047_2-20121206/16468_1 /ASSEMBLY_ACC=CAM_ASM_000192 /TAXON_ID=195065 /ORGANISM="Chroomonas mesostigmatica_cf, Strain CCMP1168" /LENGTH=486 /DNA_ID=CAMNT_0053666279 /DNA_START=867 /DNA_END=2328 /DNA_ORIENTATION=-
MAMRCTVLMVRGRGAIVEHVDLRRLDGLLRVRRLEPDVRLRQRAHDRVDVLVVHEDAAARGRDVLREVVPRRREDCGEARALADTNARLLGLVPPEDVLEAVDLEEEVDGALPKARAPPRRHPEAPLVQVRRVLLLRRRRVRPQHVVDHLVGMHGAQGALEVLDHIERRALLAQLPGDAPVHAEDRVVQHGGQGQGVEEVVDGLPHGVPLIIPKNHEALVQEAAVLVVLDVAVDLARLVVAPDHPPLVRVEDLHRHDVGDDGYAVLAPINKISQEEEVPRRHLGPRRPQCLAEELKVHEIPMDVPKHVARRINVKDTRLPCGDPCGVLSHRNNGSLQNIRIYTEGHRAHLVVPSIVHQRLRHRQEAQSVLPPLRLGREAVPKPRRHLLDADAVAFLVHCRYVRRELVILTFLDRHLPHHVAQPVHTPVTPRLRLMMGATMSSTACESPCWANLSTSTASRATLSMSPLRAASSSRKPWVSELVIGA